jgi:hypothetical protein
MDLLTTWKRFPKRNSTMSQRWKPLNNNFRGEIIEALTSTINKEVIDKIVKDLDAHVDVDVKVTIQIGWLR